ncbi:MAG: WXG100 family type VII secretion target [Nitriliruptorales bacterium]
MARVLSTEEARASITQMQAIINGSLLEQIQSLDAQGQRLSDPNVWDGQLAAQFRSTWPETKRALDNMRTQLEELRVQVEAINRNIMTAGGNV